MKGLATRKRAHRLFTAGTGDEFETLFLRETGLGVSGAIERFVQREAIQLVAVGGSIPLGIATAVSDVDFLVVVTSADAVATKIPSQSEVIFRGHPDGLILAECVAVLSGVEIDFQIVSADRVSHLFERVCHGNSAFTQEELLILSRLATGWPLIFEGIAATETWHLPWRLSLRVYCATRYYTFALKELEDAREAAYALPVLALHLGRLAVESGVRAYLASEGYTALGSKWMRLLLADNKSARTRSDEAASMLASAVGLMFPSGSPDTSPSRCISYLDQVVAFLETARGQIEKDPRLRVAFQVCPQIYRLPHTYMTPDAETRA